MKRLILALMTLAFSASLAAEWVKIGETENYEVLIDLDTTLADGYLRKSWQIRNLKTQSRAGESDLFRMQYDCKEEKNRTLYWIVYSGRFAGGKLTGLGLEASRWSPIRPYTIDWDILKIVCSKQQK